MHMDKIDYTDPIINDILAREIMGWTADVVTARDGSVIRLSDKVIGGTKWNPTGLTYHAILVAEELAGYPWSCADISIDHDSFDEEGGYKCRFPPVLSSGTMELLSQKPCEARAETMAMAICKAAMKVLECKNNANA